MNTARWENAALVSLSVMVWHIKKKKTELTPLRTSQELLWEGWYKKHLQFKHKRKIIIYLFIIFRANFTIWFFTSLKFAAFTSQSSSHPNFRASGSLCFGTFSGHTVYSFDSKYRLIFYKLYRRIQTFQPANVQPHVLVIQYVSYVQRFPSQL